jgi:catechol 2,3-dioxygenase-like lactoylglutathione lyase family enzyme
MVDAIAHVTVGVADLRPALDLWVERFGLEVVARRDGPDPDLAQLWDLSADAIVEQVLLRTPGAKTGGLHFVRFRQPHAPVRAGAAVTDLGPKNIDVNCVDMPVRYTELSAAGCKFRSAVTEYEIEGIHAREVQMPSHDDINVVLIEVLSGGFEMALSPTGYAAMTSFVVIVPDTIIEAGFYTELFGLDELMHHRISGPGIEQAVGLPEGSVLDMRLIGRENKFFGRLEIIEYEGQRGKDRFVLTPPPALGILRCAFSVQSLTQFQDRAEALGVPLSATGQVDTIFGAGPMCTGASPAGLRIDIFEHGRRKS